MNILPESYRPIPPEPLDAREVERIRTWLELNRIRLNQREAKRKERCRDQESTE